MFKYKWAEWWHSFRLSNTQRSACFLLERLQEEHTGAGAVWLEVQDRRRPRPGFLGPGNGVEMECAVPSQETWVCHFTCRMRLPHLWKAILRIDWFFCVCSLCKYLLGAYHRYARLHVKALLWFQKLAVEPLIPRFLWMVVGDGALRGEIGVRWSQKALQLHRWKTDLRRCTCLALHMMASERVLPGGWEMLASCSWMPSLQDPESNTNTPWFLVPHPGFAIQFQQ